MTTLTENVNAEGALLGSMILDRGCIPDVQQNVKDHFYFSKMEHRILYDVLCGLAETAEGWDLVIIRDELNRQGLLDTVGGMLYVVKLAETTPTAENALHYAKLVQTAYNRRRIAEQAEALKQAAASGTDVQAALSGVLGDMQELAAETVRKTPVDGAQAVKTLIDESVRQQRQIIRMPWGTVSKLTAALQGGSVTIFCGSPGASKSFAALELLAFAAEVGHPAAYYALEDNQAFHLMRLLAQKTELAGLTNPDWIAQNPTIAEAAYAENAAWLSRLGRSIDADGGGQCTYDTLTTWALRRARAGCKLLLIDPVTAVQHQTAQSWKEDNDFLQKLKRIAVDHSAAVVLVTHPSKLQGTPGMESLAGGATFSRFSQTIIWLEAHDLKQSDARYTTGTLSVNHNRTIHLLKTRLGQGQGLRIAATFTDTLRLIEHGVVCKRQRGQSNG